MTKSSAGKPNPLGRLWANPASRALLALGLVLLIGSMLALMAVS